MDSRFDVAVFEALPYIYKESVKFLGDGETPDSVLNEVLQDLVDCKLAVPEQVTMELSQLTQSEDVQNNLKVLSENYNNFKALWSPEDIEKFAENMKLNLISSSSSGQPRNFRQDGQINKSSFDSHLDALVQKGQFEQAIEELKEYRKGKPDFQASLNLSNAFLQSQFNQTNNAQEALDQFAKLETDCQPNNAIVEIALDLFKQGREEEGHAFLENIDKTKMITRLRGDLMVDLLPFTNDAAKLKQSLQLEGPHIDKLLQVFDQHLSNGNVEQAIKLRNQANLVIEKRIDFTQRQLEPLFLAKFKELGDIDQALQSLEKQLDLAEPAKLNPHWLLTISLDQIQAGQVDQALKTFEILTQHSWEDEAMMKRLVQVFFNTHRERFQNDPSLLPIMDMMQNHAPFLASYKVLSLLKAQRYDEAIEECQRSKFSNGLHELIKEFSLSKNEEKLQSLLDAMVAARGQEVALYTFAKHFFDLGQFNHAKKLLASPGLRYRQAIVASIVIHFQKLGHVQALEEFAKTCLGMYGSESNYLFETLVALYKADKNKMEDLWLVMEEHNFLPSENLLIKMGKSEKFDKADKADISTDKTKAFEKVLKEEGLEKGQAYLLQALKGKKAAKGMLSAYFSALKETSSVGSDNLVPVISAVSKGGGAFKGLLKDELRSLNQSELLLKLELPQDVKGYLGWNTFLAGQIVDHAQGLEQSLEKMKMHQVEEFVRPNSLSKLVKTETDAEKLVDYAGQHPSLNKFPAAVLVTLVLNNFDNSALKAWQLCKDLDQRFVLKEKDKIQAFATKHSLKYEAKEDK